MALIACVATTAPNAAVAQEPPRPCRAADRVGDFIREKLAATLGGDSVAAAIRAANGLVIVAREQITAVNDSAVCARAVAGADSARLRSDPGYAPRPAAVRRAYVFRAGPYLAIWEPAVELGGGMSANPIWLFDEATLALRLALL